MLEVLVLTDREIRPILTMKETIEAVEQAFREKGIGKVRMPPKQYVFFQKHNGDFRVMPAYLEKSDVAGVKTVNVHPNNPTKYGLPTVMATITLLDPKNGAPVCVMDGTWITAMRTGGAGGVAAKYLARKDSRLVGVVGAGVQARTQLIALKEVLPDIDEVRVVDKIRERSESYANEMRETLGLNVQPVDSVEEAVTGADVVVTVTPTYEPVVMSDWIKKGAHINAIGADAPGKEELDPAILKRAKIVVDDWEQAIHSGEVNVPLSRGAIKRRHIYADIGEVVTGKKAGRLSNDEITVFDSTGLAVQDVVTAWRVFERAKKADVGTWITFL